MKLTFGNWRNWDTNDMAKTTDGREYLAWGTRKLQSAMWRNEFGRALAENYSIDESLEIRAIVKSNPDIDEVDAWQIVQDRKAEKREAEEIEERVESARRQVVRKYAKITGIGEQDMRNALGTIETYVLRFDEMPPANRFSSPERAALMAMAYEEWEKCWE